jgi:uncharacterized protein with LGFP repeats
MHTVHQFRCTALVGSALIVAGALGGCSVAPISRDSATSMTAVSTARIPTAAGQFVLQGEILQKYNATGASGSPLGSPISDEEPGPLGGRYTKFQSGVIYWTSTTGAHIVWGAIRGAWEYENGGAGGPLGYPMSDEQAIPGGYEQDFQHGTITYTNGQLHIESRG